MDSWKDLDVIVSQPGGTHHNCTQYTREKGDFILYQSKISSKVDACYFYHALVLFPQVADMDLDHGFHA